MSLSGNLGFVPIDEVLRLLTRSHQQGSVDVTGSGLRGRVFVGKSGIDLATTYDDEDLHRHLVNSHYADEKALNRITSGETTLAAIAESNAPLIDLLREMTVESLYQIADRGQDFTVREQVTSPYASPKSFELEALLRDAEQRGKDWDKVSDVIPSLTTAIGFRRDLGDREEVTIKVDDWKVLSEIGVGSSVERIAELLGTTDFWTARVTARLINSDLVVVDDEGVGEYEESPAEIQYEPVEPVGPVDEYAAYEAEKAGAASDAEEGHDRSQEGAASFDSPDGEDLDPNESWWQEPQDEDGPDEDRSDQTPEVVSEGLSEIPSVEGSDDDGDVEEDTEAFLEKVFSELESSESPEDSEGTESEAEEGHGLLRRRRMGTLRDFSSDS